MLLAHPDGRAFATGAVTYVYRPATEREITPRLLIQVEIEGWLTSAVIDTGAPYVICAPQVARRLRLDPAAAIGQTRMLIRGGWIGGSQHRLTLTLPAERGDSLRIDATTFVPDARSEESWGTLPSFLGLSGCLERMRFAVDPATDTFYFGPLT